MGPAPVGYECIRLSHARQISLPLTIAYQCGQAFRWRQVAWHDPTKNQIEVEWSLCLSNRVIFVRHDPVDGYLYYRTVPPSQEKVQPDSKTWLYEYLNLSAQTEEWYKEWCARDSVFAKHARKFHGVTILRQDPLGVPVRVCTCCDKLTDQIYLQFQQQHSSYQPNGPQAVRALHRSPIYAYLSERCTGLQEHS